jgi:hypothetical protein
VEHPIRRVTLLRWKPERNKKGIGLDITKEQLETLYVEQNLTVRQCAEVLGLPTHGGISWRLKKFNIKTRPSKFQPGNRKPGDRPLEKQGGWKGGKQVVRCDVCDQQLFRFPSLINDKNFCSYACRGKWASENFNGENNPNYGSIAMFGSANPNWKGGIALDGYCDAWKDRDFKQEIKARDSYSCQNPDCRKNSNNLTVHHIDYEKGNCHPQNLITLCISCNARANFNRDFWAAGYRAIIETKYRPEELKIA